MYSCDSGERLQDEGTSLCLFFFVSLFCEIHARDWFELQMRHLTCLSLMPLLRLHRQSSLDLCGEIKCYLLKIKGLYGTDGDSNLNRMQIDFRCDIETRFVN